MQIHIQQIGQGMVQQIRPCASSARARGAHQPQGPLPEAANGAKVVERRRLRVHVEKVRQHRTSTQAGRSASGAEYGAAG